ncbi:hypothetical protein [Tsukamurella pulmonis]|nr:hypothetical protein [Tsukamurella pulmonis]
MNVAGFLRWALTKPAIILLVIVAGIAGGAIGGSRPPRTSRAVRQSW